MKDIQDKYKKYTTVELKKMKEKKQQRCNKLYEQSRKMQLEVNAMDCELEERRLAIKARKEKPKFKVGDVCMRRSFWNKETNGRVIITGLEMTRDGWCYSHDFIKKDGSLAVRQPAQGAREEQLTKVG